MLLTLLLNNLLSGTQPEPPIPEPPIPPSPVVLRGGDGSSGPDKADEWDKKILQEDEELLMILKTFLQCQE